MKKVFVSIFTILLGLTLSCGGVFLLSGCNFKPETSESGGSSTPIEPENPENPDEGKDNEDNEVKPDLNEANLSIQVVAITKSTSISDSNSAGGMNVYWRNRDDTACTWGVNITGNCVAISGHTMEGGAKEDRDVKNISKFVYKGNLSVWTYRCALVEYKSVNSAYAFFGLHKSKDNSTGRSISSSNHWIYGKDGNITTDGSVARPNCDNYCQGTFYMLYRQIYTNTYKLNGGTYNSSTSDQTQTTYAGIGYDLIGAPTRSGYTFAGWRENNGHLWNSSNPWGNNNPSTKDDWASSEKIFTAEWTANTYHLNFDADGGSMESYNKLSTAGSLICTLNGRQFYKKYAGDAYAAYAVSSTYTLPVLVGRTADSVAYYDTYDGATTHPYSGTVVVNGITWYYSSNQHWMTGSFYDTSGLIRLRLSMSSLANTAKDVVNYRASNSGKPVVFGSAYGTLPTPVRDGHTFSGWYTAKSGGTKVTSTSTYSTEGGQTLYARWEIKTYTLTIKYFSRTATNATNLNISSSSCTVSSSSIALNGSSTVSHTYSTSSFGVTISRANSSANYYLRHGSAPTTSEYNGVNSFTYYWQPTSNVSINIYVFERYAISFNGNSYTGGSLPGTVYKIHGTSATIPTNNLNRTGYSANGWNTNKDGTGTDYAAGSYSANSNLQLYAKWTANQYTVSFDPLGGSAVASKTVVYDSTYGALPSSTRVGANFGGWYKDANFTTKVDASTTVKTAANHTLYAKWASGDGNILKYEQTHEVDLITNVSVDSPKVNSLNSESDDSEVSSRASGDFVIDSNGYYVAQRANAFCKVSVSSWSPVILIPSMMIKSNVQSGYIYFGYANQEFSLSYYAEVRDSNSYWRFYYHDASHSPFFFYVFATEKGAMFKLPYAQYTVDNNVEFGQEPSIQTKNYGFELNGQGYYESQNKGEANSYALCRVYFSVKKQTRFTFIFSQDSENANDFGIIGNLNESLGRNMDIDTNIYGKFQGSNPTNRQISYSVPPGDHFIEIKYRKNAFGNAGSDTFKFKWEIPKDKVGYFYFEDGEYPQSDADKIEMASVSTGVYGGVSVDYDAVENVVTLDGQYSNSGSRYYFLKSKSFNVVAGRKVSVKIDYLGGAVTGGGRVIIAFGLFDSEGNFIQKSTAEPSLGQYSFEYINTLNSTVENGYLYFFLWRNTGDGGNPAFNKAKFRITLFYDGMSTLLKSSINLETSKVEYYLKYFNGSVNVDIPVYMYNGQKYAYVTNGSVSKWFKVEPIRWRVSEYGVLATDYPSERTDMVTFNTRDGWEIIGQQVSVTANTTYTLKVNCEAPSFNPLAGYLGLGLMVLNSAPTSSDCTSQRIERYQINQNNDGEIEFSFNTGNTTSIYIILNGGYIEDGGSYTFKFRDFSLTGGQADGFESDVSKWTKYFQSSNITVSKNVSWENYGAYNTNFTVVSDKVLGFGAVTNQNTKEGWSVTESELYANTLDYISNDQNKNKLDLKHHQTENTKVPFDKFGAVGQQDKVQSEDSTSYMGVRVASVEDVKTNLTDIRAKASDLVMFMLGLSSEWADYWTRDLGNNLDNGIVVTKSGILKSAWLNQMKGVRFAMTMNEGLRLDVI